VSIFMSVFDCHVNRKPGHRQIERIVYHHGAFLSADLDKASDNNRAQFPGDRDRQGNIGVVQIAGLVARRLCFVARRGERGGGRAHRMIARFSSGCDLPKACASGREGQTAIAG